MAASATQCRHAMPIEKERLSALPAEQLRAVSAKPIRRTDDDITVEISLVKGSRDSARRMRLRMSSHVQPQGPFAWVATREVLKR
jgi:hypothetical protein